MVSGIARTIPMRRRARRLGRARGGRMTVKRAGLGAGLVALGLGSAASAIAQDPPTASQVDAYVARPRVVVMTDIANEPDDQMSLVRFLVYSNGFDVEGLVATTSTWVKRTPRPDVIRSVIDGY